MKFFKRKREKEEYEFLPDAIEIIESPVSPLGSFMVWVLFSLLMFLLLFSYLGKVDVVSTSRGIVEPTGNVRLIKAPVGGTLNELTIKNGNQVAKGDVLATIMSGEINIEKDALQKLISDAEVERDILYVLRDNQILSAVLDPEIIEDNKIIIDYYLSIIDHEKGNQEVLEIQKKQSETNLALTASRRNNIEDNIEYLKGQISLIQESKNQETEKQAIETMEIELNILLEEEKQYVNLIKDDKISEELLNKKQLDIELLQNQIDIMETQIKVTNEKIDIEIAELKKQINGYQNELNTQDESTTLAKQQVEEAAGKLSTYEIEGENSLLSLIIEKEREINDYRIQLLRNEENLDNSIIRAPLDGYIYDIQVRGNAEVIQPAQELLKLVPFDTKLVVESYVENKDIGFIQEGQAVSIKIDTYNFQKYGVLKGEVIEISANSVLDEQRGYVYPILISLDENSFTRNNQSYDIMTGMEVTTEIKIGKRRIIDFFIEPLIKYLDESLKLP